MFQFENIPDELKKLKQWVVWRYEDRQARKPLKMPYCLRTGTPARVNELADCTDYVTAVAGYSAMSTVYDGIGFVFSASDPYAFIDLDDPESDDDIKQKQIAIYEQFVSYAEISVNGGLHIIVRGSVPCGRKRTAVEVYSDRRFAVMTGNVYRRSPIVDYQDKLLDLHNRMGAVTPPTSFRGLDHEKDTDENIYKMAYAATNGSKFYELWTGQWSKHYGSQSEADFALINILAFYSENREQVQRMFHLSELGKRQKAFREDYLNWMLNRCFDKMLPPIDVEHLTNKVLEALAVPPAPISIEAFATPIIENPIRYDDTEMPLPLPPGLLGEMVHFIYGQSFLPVHAIAISGALALMAGICGRAYNVSGTGLNLYIMLLARTGMGKEAAVKGMGRLIRAVSATIPTASEFIGPSEIASREGIFKYMAKGRPSIISSIGEFGIKLQQMSSMTAPPHLATLRSFLLEAYNKSGNKDLMPGSAYSDGLKNSGPLKSPAFSLLGDSTPQKFYGGLHEGLISEGLLPRFTVIEYKGKRAEPNDSHEGAEPSKELVTGLADICNNSMMMNSQNLVTQVVLDSQAEALLKDYRRHCYAVADSDESQVTDELWTRINVKALRVAGLAAIGCNYLFPVITLELAKWAITVCNKDVDNMMGRFKVGDIGEGGDENTQLIKLGNIIKEYHTNTWDKVAGYVGEGMSRLYDEKVLPYTFIQRRLANIAVFKNDRVGTSRAIERALNQLEQNGDIEQIPKHVAQSRYGTSAKCFIVKHPAAFGFGKK